MGLSRIIPHLFAERSMHRHFPTRVLDSIQHAVAEGEARHDGQVCFAIEGALHLRALFKNVSARQRAEEVFAHLRVWDTQNNSGVLIYVLLAEHAIEIVADRGIAARVPQSEWQSICIQMQNRFSSGEFERGAVDGVSAVSAVLAAHFPAADGKRNELQDRPVLL